jgi:hypothetical protein
VNATLRHSMFSFAFIAAALSAGGCSDFIRQDRSPVTLVIDRLEAASGASGTAGTFSGTLQSDVITNGGIFNDSGRVTMRSIMKDVFTAPTAVNAVTIQRYRVSFRRSDGRNTPGVDVPQPFESAVTFTVPPNAAASQSFELIRHLAKEEAPLRALATNVAVTIATIADVTFYGRDQTGNELSATGSIGVIFGDFADPEN